MAVTQSRKEEGYEISPENSKYVGREGERIHPNIVCLQYIGRYSNKHMQAYCDVWVFAVLVWVPLLSGVSVCIGHHLDQRATNNKLIKKGKKGFG